MRLVFDYRLFKHINESSIKERGRASAILQLAEKLFQWKIVTIPLGVIEAVLGFVLAAPVPIYSSVVFRLVNGARGLPSHAGMYFRALYYRRKLGYMGSNVFIDQNVFFAFPKGVVLRDFSYIDKNVMVMCKTCEVGRRVHIAPRVFISGGGEFQIDDYACIATNSNIITSTEVLKDGARCSGPMVTASQRNVLRGKVLIKKDAFVGANVTILPNVVMEQGSVAAAGVTIAKSTEAWGIYIGPKKVGERDKVIWPDD